MRRTGPSVASHLSAFVMAHLAQPPDTVRYFFWSTFSLPGKQFVTAITNSVSGVYNTTPAVSPAKS